jgi:hypothetical protein
MVLCPSYFFMFFVTKKSTNIYEIYTNMPNFAALISSGQGAIAVAVVFVLLFILTIILLGYFGFKNNCANRGTFVSFGLFMGLLGLGLGLAAVRPRDVQNFLRPQTAKSAPPNVPPKSEAQPEAKPEPEAK